MILGYSEGIDWEMEMLHELVDVARYAEERFTVLRPTKIQMKFASCLTVGFIHVWLRCAI